MWVCLCVCVWMCVSVCVDVCECGYGCVWVCVDVGVCAVLPNFLHCIYPYVIFINGCLYLLDTQVTGEGREQTDIYSPPHPPTTSTGNWRGEGAN